MAYSVCRMRFILLGPSRGCKIKKPGASRQASLAGGASRCVCGPGWSHQVPSVSVWQYLLSLTHAPFLGWTMLHVIGFNSVDIFLYMVLDVAKLLSSFQSKRSNEPGEDLGKGEEER